MKSEARKIIIHVMSQFYDLKALAELTDNELMKQYDKMRTEGKCDLKNK